MDFGDDDLELEVIGGVGPLSFLSMSTSSSSAYSCLIDGLIVVVVNGELLGVG